MSKNGTVNPQARDQYFAANRTNYPALNSHPEQAKIPVEKQTMDVRQPFTRQPVVAPQRNQPQMQQSQQRAQSQRVQTRTAPQQPRYNYNTIQRAQQYQRVSWEQAQPTYHAAPQYSAPERSTPSAPARSMPSAPAGGSFGGGRR